MTPATKYPGEQACIDAAAAAMRSRTVRPLSRFAEEEIRMQTGPFAGRPFRLRRSTGIRLLLQELDRKWWRRTFITGPNQDGKTVALLILLCYVLFELRESVVFGVPSKDMVADKWRLDIEPFVRKSFPHELPLTGPGSRGGEVDTAVQFRNGSVLRFMTAGGDDQSRAGLSSRWLFVTETDGFDEIGGSSREGSKFNQLERRTLAWGKLARVVAECTMSTEAGRTAVEIKQGTASRIMLPCPHCGEHVCPEREHLVGWQEAETDRQAARESALACPECGAAWTFEQRVAANSAAVLVHKGQVVAKTGKVEGDEPDTHTLGFRWSCVNSVVGAELGDDRVEDVAVREWRADRSADPDAAETDVLQSQWAMPAKPSDKQLRAMSVHALAARQRQIPMGVVPKWADLVTVGVDMGGHLCHWVAIAWKRTDATSAIFDYGVFEVPLHELGQEAALQVAVAEFRDEIVAPGWPVGEPDSPQRAYSALNLLDSGWLPEEAYRLCEASGELWRPSKGVGVDQYRQPKAVEWATAHAHATELDDWDTELVLFDADHAKGFIHARLSTPPEQPGAMLFNAPEPRKNHVRMCHHLLSERQEVVPRRGGGTVSKFTEPKGPNHYLDGAALAGVGAEALGVTVHADTTDESVEPPPALEPTDWMSPSVRY